MVWYSGWLLGTQSTKAGAGLPHFSFTALTRTLRPLPASLPLFSTTYTSHASPWPIQLQSFPTVFIVSSSSTPFRIRLGRTRLLWRSSVARLLRFDGLNTAVIGTRTVCWEFRAVFSALICVNILPGKFSKLGCVTNFRGASLTWFCVGRLLMN